MSDPVKPEMAYPDFTSPTASFAPSKWPVVKGSAFAITRYSADARTAAGLFIRQQSPISERVITIHYRLLTTAERDSFASPSGAGFYFTVGGQPFEYKHLDGEIYQARFITTGVKSTPQGYDRWEFSPIEIMLI